MVDLYPTYHKLSEFEKFQIIPSKYQHLMEKLPSKLLGYDTNTKVEKGKKQGYTTGVNYMSPYKTYPYGNVCAMADKFKCHGPCLNESGRGKFSVNQVARFRKLALFKDHPELFKEMLIKDIETGIRKAKRDNTKVAIRINGTSDIDIVRLYLDILKEYEDEVEFYDYTKIVKYLLNLQKLDNQISNYHLTFSYSKVNTAQEYIEQATKTKFNIAMVIKNENQVTRLMENEHKIKLYGREYNLINGDDDDLRFLDTNNSIVLLKYKETRASQEDINNFVVDIDDLPRNVELT